jgi:hypothetical protein
MTVTSPCKDCGELVPLGTKRCPRCGSEQGIVVEPGTAKLTLTTYPPTIIIFGFDKASGNTVERVDAPDTRSITVHAPGARSITRHTGDGTVSVVVDGAGGVGRPGEARVAKVLRACLKNEGVESEERPGKDDCGEDRLLDAAGESYVLQIVTVPKHSDFWRVASVGSATTSVVVAQAGEWIEESIKLKVQKTSEYDRGKIILALDANHAGVLADQTVVEPYLERYGSPTERFKFASVWLVGPTPAQCVRLGTGVL